MINFKDIKLLIALILCSLAATGQDTIPHQFAATASYHRGFLIAHRPMVVPLQQDKANGYELSFALKPNGSKDWHHVYGFPEAGVSVAVWDVGNPDQIGKIVSVIPYMDFPLAKGKKSSFDLKFGWGLGYVQKRFDADENYKNVAVGSHLNFALILQPHYKIHISEQLTFRTGISLTHYSNGSAETPNLGLNVASVTAGATWNFGKPLPLQKKELPSFSKSNRYTVYGAVSTKQIYPADGKNYFVASVSANRVWQVSRKSAFGAGADLFYDQSIEKKAEDQNVELNSSLETFRGGIHGSYELVIADLSFAADLGLYVYSKLDDGAFYQRIGLRYKINESLFAVMHIKAHWGKADFAEIGLGYKFPRRTKSSSNN